MQVQKSMNSSGSSSSSSSTEVVQDTTWIMVINCGGSLSQANEMPNAAVALIPSLTM